MDDEIHEDNSIYPDPEEYSQFGWLGGGKNISTDEFLSISRGPIVQEGFVPDSGQNANHEEMEVDDGIEFDGEDQTSNGTLKNLSSFVDDNEYSDSLYSSSESSL